MERHEHAERSGWVARVEDRGLRWHTGETPYWCENAYYSFTAREIETIERATNELHARCLDAVQHVIDERRFGELKIPDHAIPLIKSSWEAEPPSLYGRFDLAYAGSGAPVMLEYNADTPTSLLEASVIQWDWLQDNFPKADQFNSIHERLVELWRSFKPYLAGSDSLGPLVHVASMEDTEDAITAAYLAETAVQAGLRAHPLQVLQIGWNSKTREFVDQDERRIDTLFKLYPWEWLVHEPFAQNIGKSRTQFIEPAWKMVLSNKGILAILWELFPGHANLCPAYLDGPRGMAEYVRKPLLSREGANVSVHTSRGDTETAGEYGAEGFVYQALAHVGAFGGRRPVLGSWMIGQEAGGMGIRESDGLVTGNTSRFVPHLFT